MGCDESMNNPRGTPEQSAKDPKPSPELPSGDIFSRGPTTEQLEALRIAAEAHKAAQAQIMEAAGLLWNSQVDVAMTLGGPHGASIAMSRRLNFFDNCTCSPCPIIVSSW